MRLVKRLPSGTVDEMIDITPPNSNGPGDCLWAQRVRGTTRLETARKETIRTQARFNAIVRDVRFAGWKVEEK
ncbi:MAG: hypothetical protein A2V70_01180 [Planctomycetes bacterium RBG_13_63_9]|nr:MAG: hypothetical protein A2V70_01180 [Planctomycetes bacterium RBG_13_63_9]